jgi:quinol monooxygenase YgiN
VTTEQKTQVVCIAEFVAFEGKFDELLKAMHALMAPTHREAGCLRYELNRRTDAPNVLTYVEKWRDQRSFDEHCATPYIARFFTELRPRLAERFEVKMYREVLP